MKSNQTATLNYRSQRGHNIYGGKLKREIYFCSEITDHLRAECKPFG